MNTSGTILARFARQDFLRVLILLCGLIILPGISYTGLMAQGNLLITPRRVVFEGTKRNEELNLANTGIDSATYNVSLVQYRMKEDGAFEEIKVPDSGQFFADKYIRFFPRTVTLAPNEAQVVKMQLFRTNNIPAGEYRSHVYFRAVPKQTALGEEEKPKDSTTLSVKLVPIFGITIPVIIRVGENTMKVTLSDLSFEMINDTVPRLNLAFNRTGNISVYGDLAVNHVSPDGIATQVGTIRGIAVYTPNVIRRIKMDLNRIPVVNFSAGKLQVIYSGQTDAKPVKYAEAELLLR
ncbi:MAG: molecular chaperone [Bacteroidia bacterium]|nr:molecular chaperone [Bacteroidia bacterium]